MGTCARAIEFTAIGIVLGCSLACPRSGEGSSESASGASGSSASGGSSTSSELGGSSGRGASGGSSTSSELGGSSGRGATGGSSSSGRGASGGLPASSATGGSPGNGASGGPSGSTGSGGGSGRADAGSNDRDAAAVGAEESAKFPFPQERRSPHCIYPTDSKSSDAQVAYSQWKDAVLTSEGAGGFLRVKKPDSGTIVGSTVSEGIGYGMILAVYMNDQSVFDGLWKYEQIHLDAQGLMNWEIGPDGSVTSGGTGAATDGDEDMAWALLMADRQWGGRGSLANTYLYYAEDLINRIWVHEVDHTRGDMLKPGDQWGDRDVTNPSYFAPMYYRLFGQVTGKIAEWNRVIDSSYAIIENSLNESSGNADNGLVPAWCDSSGTPVEAYSGAPLYFQNDSTRTPFRIGQDACFFGEPRAKAYLARISAFYERVGVDHIVNGYNLDGTPHPEKTYADGLQAASFIGPAGVGAMSDPRHQALVDQAYSKVASLKLTAGTIYYQKSWTALSLLMLTGNLVDFTEESARK